MIAALRDPNLKNRACIRRQDEKHTAVEWLTDEVHVDFPGKNNAGVIQVSATEPDREDAAAIVNAVVSAYWNEVVNFEQQQQQKRLTELQKLHAEKEIEVRNKREQLKRELENIGAGDDQTMRARTELAVCVYLDFQREFQRMKLEHRTLVGKLAEAKQTYGELQDVEIAEAEVLSLLYGDPVYHDLRSRLANLQSNRPRTNTVRVPERRHRPGRTRPRWS